MALVDMSETFKMTNVGEHIDATEVSATHPNLLDNPFFTINQRSFTTQDFGSSGNGYTVDRWKAYRSVVTVKTDGSLDVTPNTGDYGLSQFFDASRLVVGDTYTVSANVGGDIHTWTFVYSTSAEYSTREADGSRFYRHTGSGICDIWFCGTANTTYNLRSMKLEKGSVSTLANDAPPDYWAEWAKCRRYFKRIYAYSAVVGAIGVSTSATNAQFLIGYEPMAKLTVNATYSGNLTVQSADGSTHAVTAVSASTTNGGGVVLSVTSSGLVAGDTARLRINTTESYFDLSADL